MINHGNTCSVAECNSFCVSGYGGGQYSTVFTDPIHSRTNSTLAAKLYKAKKNKGLQMVPGWSLDGQQKSKKKLEKSWKKVRKKFAGNGHFCHSISFFPIKYRRATTPSFSLQCLLDGSSNLAQGYIFWESFVNPSGKSKQMVHHD